MRCQIIFVTILVGLSVLMAGCRGAKETDEVAFITTIGIDQAEQDKIKVTYQILIPRAVGGLQGAGQEIKDGPVITNSIIAVNTAEAFNLLNSTTSRYINLTHLKAIVISEALARQGVGDIIAPLLRYREYRGTMLIHVAKGQVEDLLLKNKPKLDYLPSKWVETLMATADENSYYTPTDIHDFYLRLKNPGGSPYAAYVGANPLSGEDKPADDKVPNQQADAYLPAGIPRTSAENPSEIAGIAVFAGDKMVGTLDTRQTRTLRILQNKLPRGFFVLADPLEPQKLVNISMRNGSKPQIRVDLIDGQEIIKIDLFLEGDITSIPSGINYETAEYRERLEAEISKVVKQEIQDFIRHTQKLGSDVFGFGYYLRPHFATYAKLEQANLEELYTTATVKVQATTKIRRTGLMWRSSPYKPAANSQ